MWYFPKCNQLSFIFPWHCKPSKSPLMRWCNDILDLFIVVFDVPMCHPVYLDVTQSPPNPSPKGPIYPSQKLQDRRLVRSWRRSQSPPEWRRSHKHLVYKWEKKTGRFVQEFYCLTCYTCNLNLNADIHVILNDSKSCFCALFDLVIFH